MKPADDAQRRAFFESLPEFAQGYLEAAFSTPIACRDKAGGAVKINGLGLDEAPMELLEVMADDAIRFQTENAEDLTLAVDGRDYTMTEAGHDFWLNRNGYGDGYWDTNFDAGGDPVLAAMDSLTMAAKTKGAAA